MRRHTMKTGLAVGVFIVGILLIHGCSWFKTQTDRPEDLGYITGRILDSNGDPIESAIVRVDTLGRQAVTDNLGWYRLEIPKGTWDVTIYKSGFRDELREGVFVLPDEEINVGLVRLDTDDVSPDAENQEASDRSQPSEKTTRKQGTGRLSGRIINSQTGKPIPLVNIIVVGTMFGAATDENGEFFVIGFPRGEYSIKASMIGFRDVVMPQVKINAGSTTDIGDILLEASEMMSGEIEIKAQRELIQSDITVSTRAISQDAIDSLKVHTFQEIMDERTSSKSTEENLHIRGGRAGKSVYLVDGMKIEEPLTSMKNNEPPGEPLPEPPPSDLKEEVSERSYKPTVSEKPENILRRVKSENGSIKRANR